MSNKGQAAMEFLMTYGWAIIIVLAAIGALAYFGVLSPQKLLPDRTTFSAPIPNVDNAVVSLSGKTVEIAFRNNKGVSIVIPQTGTFTSVQCTEANAPFVSVTDSSNSSLTYGKTDTDLISNGAGFLVKWTCTPAGTAHVGDKFKADVSFDYKNSETGQTIKQTGSIEGKWS